MALAAVTYIKDSVLFVRDYLRTNLTDPLSRTGADWILTAYPDTVPRYPIVIVRKTGATTPRSLGHQSEAQLCYITLEVRVFSKSVSQRDGIAQQVHDLLRTGQFGTGSTDDFEMHDMLLTSSVPVDEDGEEGIHSEVMEFRYMIILT